MGMSAPNLVPSDAAISEARLSLAVPEKIFIYVNHILQVRLGRAPTEEFKTAWVAALTMREWDDRVRTEYNVVMGLSRALFGPGP